MGTTDSDEMEKDRLSQIVGNVKLCLKPKDTAPHNIHSKTKHAEM
jgi:hypothetical protein